MKKFFVLSIMLFAILALSSSAIAEEKNPKRPAAPSGLTFIDLLYKSNDGQTEIWGIKSPNSKNVTIRPTMAIHNPNNSALTEVIVYGYIVSILFEAKIGGEVTSIIYK